jgi:general secretion pathway protein H
MELTMSKVAKKTIEISSAGNDEAYNSFIKPASLGFTLLELTLVMFFMALIAGLTTPFIMSTLDRMEMQSAARKMASALRFARSEAITIKKPVIFSGNITQNHYWISAIEVIKNPRIRSLKNPIRLAQFMPTEENDPVSEGKFTITFFPQGNSSGGEISINIKESRESENYYVINIDPITGRTKIKESQR